MGSPCIECDSYETEMVRYDDGHFRKECSACGYVGGPYISNQNSGGDDEDDEESEVSTLDEWLS